MAGTLPATHRAWVVRRTGNPRDVLKLEGDHPIPVPKEKQLLVRVHAVSLNPAGFKSFTQPPFSWIVTKPAIPEFDFSGVIAGGDLDGTGLVIGQEVFGIKPAATVIKAGQGTLTQYMLCGPQNVVAKPSNITHAEAAAFPLAGLTAHLALVIHGGLRHGDGKRVFVNGGSGGVGSWAVQIAKAYGAYVVTTCSPDSQPLVTSLGPDATIDYRSVKPSLTSHLASTYATSKFDLVFDTVGMDVSTLFAACPEFLQPDGVFLDAAGGAHVDSIMSAFTTIAGLLHRKYWPVFLGGTPRRYVDVTLWANSVVKDLQECAELLASGQIKARIDHTYAFEDALDAYDRLMSGRAKGKVVVSVD